MFSRLRKIQQVLVDLINQNVRQRMWSARISFQCSLLQQLDSFQRTIRDRHNLVIGPMQQKYRNIKVLHVLDEVGLRKCRNAVVRAFKSTQHTLFPPALNQSLRYFCAWTIKAKEWTSGDVKEESCSIYLHCSAEAIEN